MITDTMTNLINYRSISDNINTVIDWLQKNDLKSLPEGKISIDGDKVFVNIISADLRPPEDAAFEFHRIYADLQIDIDGNEYWDWSPADTSSIDYNSSDDVGFATVEAQASGILTSDRFVLFFPGELHKPSCRTDSCSHLRKAVFKIKIV